MPEPARGQKAFRVAGPEPVVQEKQRAEGPGLVVVAVDSGQVAVRFVVSEQVRTEPQVPAATRARMPQTTQR